MYFFFHFQFQTINIYTLLYDFVIPLKMIYFYKKVESACESILYIQTIRRQASMYWVSIRPICLQWIALEYKSRILNNAYYPSEFSEKNVFLLERRTKRLIVHKIMCLNYTHIDYLTYYLWRMWQSVKGRIENFQNYGSVKTPIHISETKCWW